MTRRRTATPAASPTSQSSSARLALSASARSPLRLSISGDTPDVDLGDRAVKATGRTSIRGSTRRARARVPGPSRRGATIRRLVPPVNGNNGMIGSKGNLGDRPLSFLSARRSGSKPQLFDDFGCSLARSLFSGQLPGLCSAAADPLARRSKKAYPDFRRLEERVPIKKQEGRDLHA